MLIVQGAWAGSLKKILLIQVFSSHRDYRSEQILPCVRALLLSSMVWFGFSLPKPGLKHIGRSSAVPGGCSCSGSGQLPASRSMLQCSEWGWLWEPEPLCPKTSPPLPAPSPGTPRIWSLCASVDYATDVICIW